MRVLVCGDREWTDRDSISRVLQETGWNITVIHGACRGADMIADQIAQKMGVEVLSFPAKWDKYGKAAGPIRNLQMLDEGKPDLVIAFHPDIAKSKGTYDMICRANKAGVPVKIISR